jgi:tetratricopeptide (TPR) repeat protein
VARWLLIKRRVRVGKSITVVTVISMAVASVRNLDAGTPEVEIEAQIDARAIDVLRADAAHALAGGDFARARILHEKVSLLDRTDAHAAREAGRAAQALGDFAYAAEALRRADVLAGHASDPELHYLRGEALYALGRPGEARREHDVVERELAATALTRPSRLWLARVYARRGNLDRADAVYRTLALASDPLADAEVSIQRAEAHFLNHDWNGARHILETFLARSPDHPRALDLLAAVLEASHHLNDELALRSTIAARATTSRQLFDYGRALERSGDFAGALREYQRAGRLSGGADEPELTRAVQRMALRTSVEVAASVFARRDPNASSLGEQVGIAAPFGSAHHLVFGAWREHMTSAAMRRASSAGELWTGLALHHRIADAVVGGKLGYLDLDARDHATSGGVSGSGFVSARARPAQHLELAFDGEVAALWRDTPLALLEGGRSTGVTANVYAGAFADRLIVNAGAQRRRLVLSGRSQGRDPATAQLLGWAGCDVVVWANFEHALEGAILDDNLLRPAQPADSVVVSYRRRELRSEAEPAFMERISMIARASIDEGSLVARKVMVQNRIGLELRGALGWDHRRDKALSRIGASLLVAPTRSSRISLVVDVGAESVNGFQGQVRTGWVSYHADL